MSDTLMEKMLGLPEFEVTDFKQNDKVLGLIPIALAMASALTFFSAIFPRRTSIFVLKLYPPPFLQ